MNHTSKVRGLALAALTVVAPLAATGALFTLRLHGQVRQGGFDGRDQSRRMRLSPNGNIDDESNGAGDGGRVFEAPSGFDSETNGFDPQGPDYESLNKDNVVALRSFNDNRFIFQEVETTAHGLGPTYNAQSDRDRHHEPVADGASRLAG